MSASLDLDSPCHRRHTYDGFDFPQDMEPRMDVPHRRGSLCDRNCGINIQADFSETHSPTASHQHGVLTHRLTGGGGGGSTMCHHLSEEAQNCDSCLTKTTLMAENEVEANKLANNYKFGFKKWKSHVTERPWEDRSDIVKELYSELNVVKSPTGRLLTCGNVLYLLLFGWWVCLFYLLVSALMFLTIVGAPYGKLCWKLAGYFLWPFGKVIQKIGAHHRRCCMQFNNCEATPEVEEVKEATPLIRNCGKDHHKCHADRQEVGYWNRSRTVVWVGVGERVITVVTHQVRLFFSFFFFFFLKPFSFSFCSFMQSFLSFPCTSADFNRIPGGGESEVILCCYHASNSYYYKYTVDGLNVFAQDLLPFIITSLVLGYVDQQNQLTSSPVKFALSLVSIMPLSYYIGMAIARKKKKKKKKKNFLQGAMTARTVVFGSILKKKKKKDALISGLRERDQACEHSAVNQILKSWIWGVLYFQSGSASLRRGVSYLQHTIDWRTMQLHFFFFFFFFFKLLVQIFFSVLLCGTLCAQCVYIVPVYTTDIEEVSCCQDHMENNGTLFYSHVEPLVYTVSVLLPIAYIIGLVFSLKTHSHIYDIHVSDCHAPGHHRNAIVHWSRWRALIILVVATLFMSACADLVTEHINPILTHSTVSQYFIGVTLLAMVPELPEIVNGIQFALQNNLSLSIEVGSSIAVQVCMLQIPVLVLFSVFCPKSFTLLFSDLHLWASIFSVILMNYIFMDGKCDYFQGTVLVVVYLILMAMYFFAPSPIGC
uniref:Cation/H+ exchanger protein 2 n=1 Tax=Latimeria chalumnae TaxID=7897 RepID=H3B195_LATCH